MIDALFSESSQCSSPYFIDHVRRSHHQLVTTFLKHLNLTVTKHLVYGILLSIAIC
ncbi:MAG: hypothetical protein QXG82_07225 [Sulfolobales archaeon]